MDTDVNDLQFIGSNLTVINKLVHSQATMLKYKIVVIRCKVVARPVRVDPTLRRDQVSGEWPLGPLLDFPIIFTSICQRAIVILTTNILPSWFYLHRAWMFCKYWECVGWIIISYGAVHLSNTQIYSPPPAPLTLRRRMSKTCKKNAQCCLTSCG